MPGNRLATLKSMTDASQFNIRDEAGNLLCPCCGFAGFSRAPAYDATGGVIGRAICPCCLWEPGFDDDAAASTHAASTILESLKAYRRGHNFRQFKGRLDERPVNWDGDRQLEALFRLAPHVR